MAELSKFDELHLKTDIELLQLIEHELDRGIREAAQAVSTDYKSSAESHSLNAQRAYFEASRLALLLDDHVERPKARLRHLKELLAELSLGAVRTSDPQEEMDTIFC